MEKNIPKNRAAILKISHIIPSIDISTGGPARSVTNLITIMLSQNKALRVDLNTFKSEKPIIKEFKSNHGLINFHKYGLFQFSKSLRKTLNNTKTAIFHGHAIWDAPVHQMAKIAQSRNIPYIITPRGMLEPWSLKQGRIKKKIALTAYQNKDLKLASCIHATAQSEADNIRALGFKNPIAIIPNGISLKDFPVYKKKFPAKRKVLFLSRIHPKKGIELLINAWKELASSITQDWEVEIVGNGDAPYIASLKKLIDTLNLEHEIIISQPVFGEKKIKKYQNAHLFVLPTYSENFGIVIAEALASYTPVITTKGTPWKELNIHKAGWWIDIGIEPLKQALGEAMRTKKSDLITMGENGRKLIEDKYSMEGVGEQMLELYQWILTKNNKPKFVEVL